MTEENRADVLPRFFGLSRQEARHMASEIDPATVIPRKTVVTAVVPGMQQPAVPPRTAPSGSVGSTVELILTHPGRGIEWVRTKVDPLSVTESRLHITVSREFLALLKQAKAGESHRSPGATDEQVLKVALEALIEKQRRRKAGVPAKVKREVVRRDGGRCQWPLAGGGVCGSTARLEVDHVVPRGRGGADTVENTRLLCRTHNLEAARRAYGDELIDRYAGAPRAPGGP
jgi:hypothetical protein